MGLADRTDRFDPPDANRFEIVRELGAGGMGVVFEAHDLRRGTRVALKQLRRLSPDALLRFKTEFRALQDLRHPNLVRLDELICDDGQWCFTMECVDGVDFLSYVGAPGGDAALAIAHTLDDDAAGDAQAALTARARPQPLSARRFDEPRLRAALAQLVAVLAVLHDAGKVHRDIKPSNILVTPAGRVVLLDFGVIADLRRAPDGHVVGTPLYMAPEQADAHEVGPAADWYAVGLVLYQALTGQLPFGASPRTALELRKWLEPIPPSELAAGVPADLERLCLDLLHLEPDARPGDAEVLRRLSLGGGPASARARFVGRLSELAELEACLVAVRERRGRTLLVHGESGAGKSALVSRFLTGLDPAVVVLAGRCCERESVPYNAVDGAVDALSWYVKRRPPAHAAVVLPRHVAALAQLFPVLQRASVVAAELDSTDEPAPEPRELRLRAFAALRELIGNIARHQPVVLAIDDLQWADADSLALLADLVAPPALAGVLVLATVRSPNSPADPATSPPPLPDAHHLRLAGLSPDDARELADELLAGAAPRSADHRQLAATIADESRGHPLFIDELVRHQVALGASPAMPRLDDALAVRVRELELDERRVLELVAVAGAPLTPDLASSVTALGFDALTRRVASLRGVNLIRSAVTTSGPTIEPYHDRVRRAVLAGLAPAAQRALHLQLAEALEQRGADAELLAVHYHDAGESHRAAPWAAIAAARAAQQLAFVRAANLFSMAAADIPAGTAEGQRLRLGLAEALVNAGRSADAARAFEEAAHAADAARAGDLQRRAAEHYLRSGNMDAGLAAAARALEPLGLVLPRTSRRALISLILRRTQLRVRGLRYRERSASEVPAAALAGIDACYAVASGLGMVDHVRGAEFQTRNLLWALDAGEPCRLSRALSVEAGFVAARGVKARPRALRILELASRLAHKIDHPHTLGLLDAFAGIIDFAVGEWRTARLHCERAQITLRERCLGVTWEVGMMEFVHLWAVFYQGELAEVTRRVMPLLHDAEDRGDRQMVTNLRTSFVPFMQLAADRPREAYDEGAQAVRAWSSTGFHLQHYNFEIFSDGQISLYLGEAEAAHRRIAARWPALRASMLTMIQHLRIEALHVRARCALAAALDARGAARASWLRAAARDRRRIARERAPWARGWVDLLAAGSAAVRGEHEAAAAAVRAAIAGFDATGMALYAAAGRCCLGALLQGDEGRALVTAATARMTSEGIRQPRRMAAVLAPGFSR